MPRPSREICSAGSGRCAKPRDRIFTWYLAGSLIVSATLLAGRSARADCTPQATGQSNLVATCTGTTVNQAGYPPGNSLGGNGYGTGAEIGTVTVAPGATVTGGNTGIAFGDVTLINNAGATVAGAAFSVVANTGSVNITNFGNLNGTPGGEAILANTDATVTNNAGASINGALVATNGDANVSNYSSIGGGVFAHNNATVTNYASGSLQDAVFASFGRATISNAGTISATGGGQAAIYGATGVTVTNSAGATISASNPSLATIFAFTGSSFIFNAGTISSTGPYYAIWFYSGTTNNILTLGPGSNIAGEVRGTGTDTFQLGGSGTGSFDISQVGSLAQYRGFSTFNKIGDSTWILTGTSTFAGPVNVNGGTLLVNGNISSASGLTVNSGATLGGTGTVGSVAVNGGTLAPGNSIGTLTVAGSLSFTAASTYLIEVSPSSSDRTNVTGTAALGGATVQAMFAPGSYVAKQYTVLNARLGVNGTFGSLVNTNLPVNFNSSLSYDANNAYLNLKLNYVLGSLNTNQRNVAGALTNFFNATGGIYAAYGSLTSAGLTQASGEAATGSQQATFNAMNQFMGVLTDPFIAGRGDIATSSGATSFAADNGAGRSSRPERDAYAAVFTKAPVAQIYDPRWNIWAAGFGGAQTTDGNAALGSNNTTSSLAGVAVGADYRFSPDTVAGFAMAGGGTSFSVDNSGYGRSDLFQAGAFVRHKSGPAYVSAALAYGFQDVTTDRIVTIAGVDRLHAAFNANAYSGRIEGGYRFATPWLGGIGLTPYAAAQFTTFDLPAYAEQAQVGTPAFALAYAAKTVTDSRSELGVRSDKSFAVYNAMLTLRGRLAWAHDFNSDRSIGATFQALPGASFVVNGAAQPHDSALTSASAEVRWMNGWSAAATFEGEFADTVRSYAGKGVVRYSW